MRFYRFKIDGYKGVAYAGDKKTFIHLQNIDTEKKTFIELSDLVAVLYDFESNNKEYQDVTVRLRKYFDDKD